MRSAYTFLSLSGKNGSICAATRIDIATDGFTYDNTSSIILEYVYASAAHYSSESFGLRTERAFTSTGMYLRAFPRFHYTLSAAADVPTHAPAIK